MKFCFLLVFLYFVPQLRAQKSITEKIQKELGEEYVHFDPGFLSQEALDLNEIDTIWSRTRDSVVLGYSYRGEFVQWPDTTERIEILYPMLIGSSPVMKGEYLVFRNWVQDSIARTKLYFGMADDEDALKWINYRTQYYDSIANNWRDFDPSDRDFNMEIYSLNWDQRLEYTSPENLPILLDMYLPLSQCFRGNRVIDKRKLYYSNGIRIYQSGSLYVPTYIDSYDWMQEDSHNFGLRSVLSFLDDQLYKENPITHIEPFMAEAYCDWKSKQLTKEFSKYGVKIVCRLAKPEEVRYVSADYTPSFDVPEIDHTEFWKITNSEYRAFCQMALDSIKIEYLYDNVQDDKVAFSLLIGQDQYLGEGNLEYVFTDISARQINRKLFRLNYDAKIKRRRISSEVLDVYDEVNPDSIAYHYEWFDARTRALDGEVGLQEHFRSYRNSFDKSLVLVEPPLESGEPNGEDLALDGYRADVFGGHGTRSQANFQRFFVEEVVILQNPNQIPENDDAADVSYEQALAFYNWKYRIDLFEGDENDEWQQFIFPTEEEFERIKKGESIRTKATAIPFDSPVFRMVVEAIPISR